MIMKNLALTSLKPFLKVDRKDNYEKIWLLLR
jgi:hypothetical protein